jgi:mono/diheme cytochrome c family protein
VGILFAEGNVLDEAFSGALLLAGYSTANGPHPVRSKRIVAFQVVNGRLVAGPSGLVAYRGPCQSTILGLAQGPDGLYFTDPFGEQSTGNAAGKGRVMRVSPSPRTAALPVNDKPPEWKKWSSIERGKNLFVFKGSCGSCHTVKRLSAGREGPNLSHSIPELRKRLESRAYWDEVQRAATTRAVSHQAAINEVRASSGAMRVRTWLRHHVLDPRFDNPRSKMPGFGQAQVFDEEELESLIDFVLSLE